MDGFIPLIFLVAGIGIAIRLVAGAFDHGRIGRYVRSRDGRVLESHWSPFGTGWFGEKNDRIYDVRYVDADGNKHRATCKTSMFSGVYFTEDRIVDRPEWSEPLAVSRDETVSLEEENRRLKAELERLKRGQV